MSYSLDTIDEELAVKTQTKASSGVQAKGKKKILVVEDDLSVSKFLGVRLRSLGFEVFVAYDGEEGLKEAKLRRPDLVILDLRLPRMTGEEVCKAIRADYDKKFAATPILMLSAKNSDVDRVMGMVLGADSYLANPFKIENLLKELKKFNL